MSEDTSNNALGLDFADKSDSHPPSEPSPDPNTVKKEKEKPYVNPERVKTGGAQRDKLSEEALQERMALIREKNEKIKQRRLDVQADEEAFRKMQEAERVKQAEGRKLQAEIDRARDQNAKRKMDKVQNREWDSGKGSGERRGPPQKKTDSHNSSASNQHTSKQPNFNKPNSSKPDSGKPTSNELLAVETPAKELNPDGSSLNQPILDLGPPEIPEITVSADIFSLADRANNDYSAWLTPGDTSAPQEAFTDTFSPAAQEKPDYSEWSTGDTSQATQNYGDWSTPDQSATHTRTHTGSYQSSKNRGHDRARGRGRGRGRGDAPGTQGTGTRRGIGKEGHRPS